MHSSRMRTARSLTVFPGSLLPSRGSAFRGSAFLGGLPKNADFLPPKADPLFPPKADPPPPTSQGRPPPPPGVDRMTDAYENITFARFATWVVIISYWELAPPPGKNPGSATDWRLSKVIELLIFRCITIIKAYYQLHKYRCFRCCINATGIGTKILNTIMHSSRMRTARLRVVSGGGKGVDVLTWSRGGGGICSDLVPGRGGGRRG